MKPLLSQVVLLTKTILLHPRGHEQRPSVQFMAGKHPTFGFPSGIGLSWWYGDDTFQAIDAVTTLLIQESDEFRDCDPESVSDITTKTLQEICVDGAIFDADRLFQGEKRSLFECRTRPVPEFAELILRAIKGNLRSLLGRRCTLYTVPRFAVKSFCLEDGSLHVIDKEDGVAWQGLVDKGYEFDGWTPMRPFSGLRGGPVFTPTTDFDCILAAEEHGTQRGSHFNSILRFRKVLAVLFCLASKRANYVLHKAAGRTFQFCIQFPHKADENREILRTKCEPLIPYFSSKPLIDTTDVAAVLKWYDACERCSRDTQQRIEKGAHFLNRALNSDDIEAYINYFVTLDALFGERNSVELSIERGIRSLGIGDCMEKKISWLFDLRNELVHGGSRYIAEWPKFTRYNRHFRTKPFADISRLAQFAVLNAPWVLEA